MTVLAVAAISARMLAEAAALDGYSVVALDLFGDADTRRASQRWGPIGDTASMQIDGAQVLHALRELARQDGDAAIGWIPGGGFEGQPELLGAGARLLPLIGTPADAVRRVRNPGEFFGALARHGITHPPVRASAPDDAEGWLLKDAHGCGGWHIRPATDAHDAAIRPSNYFQREMPGVPMSATFIANGEQAMLLGINELIVRPLGTRPHVYRGCVGPVTVAPDLARRVGVAVRTLTAEFGLRGWCSLDFMHAGDAIAVLEVNPRPPASLSLYARRGLIDAQLQACLRGELPVPEALAPGRVRGSEIVYARRSLTLDLIGAQHLARRNDVHDRPVAGARFAAGDPICSLSAAGDSAEQVRALLGEARDALTQTLETPS